ncbi:MAG: redoxin domain-containing protein [Planctomycetota bacterium]
MMSRFNILLSSLLVISLVFSSTGESIGKDVEPLEIGAAAPDFELPGVDGKTHSLADFADAKVLVVIFTCNHCPTAQAYEDRIIQLHADYKDRGMALVAISPNDPQAVRLDELGYSDVNDSLEDMKVRARDKDFKFPYLYDGETQETSTAYGVLATPHVFIFDAERKLRYVGGFDNADVGPVKSHDTRNAVAALLKNEPVPREKTRVFGCSTKWSDKRKSTAESLKKWNAEPVSLNTIDEAGVRELVKNDTKKYRLINVWATWCVPCVEELAELVTINRMYRRRPFEAITISLDGPENRDQALEVLEDKHVSCTNYLFNSTDRDSLADALDKKWRGPVPYTLLIAPGGKVVYRKESAFDPLTLKQVIVERLGRTYASR